MNYQVNLLEEAEVRDTSKVSQKFMTIIGAGSLVALLFLSVLFISWRLNSLEGKLEDTQTRIDGMNDNYERAIGVKKALGEQKRALEELEGWQAASVDLDQFLAVLAKLVPANIQLMDLQFRGNLAQRPPEKDKPIERVREYGLKLSGNAVGIEADGAVLDFIRSLQDSEDFEGLVTTAKLQRMQNAGSALDDEAEVVRSFSIDCMMEERPWR